MSLSVGLFDLPRELRDIIYAFTFTEKANFDNLASHILRPLLTCPPILHRSPQHSLLFHHISIPPRRHRDTNASKHQRVQALQHLQADPQPHINVMTRKKTLTNDPRFRLIRFITDARLSSHHIAALRNLAFISYTDSRVIVERENDAWLVLRIPAGL